MKLESWLGINSLNLKKVGYQNVHLHHLIAILEMDPIIHKWKLHLEEIQKHPHDDLKENNVFASIV